MGEKRALSFDGDPGRRELWLGRQVGPKPTDYSLGTVNFPYHANGIRRGEVWELTTDLADKAISKAANATGLPEGQIIEALTNTGRFEYEAY